MHLLMLLAWRLECTSCASMPLQALVGLCWSGCDRSGCYILMSPSGGLLEPFWKELSDQLETGHGLGPAERACDVHVQKAEDALQGVWTLPTGTGSRQTALGNLYVAAKISPLAVSPKNSFQGGDHTNSYPLRMCRVVRLLYSAFADTHFPLIKHQSSTDKFGTVQ